MCLPDPPVDPLIQPIPWDLKPLSQFHFNTSLDGDLDLPVDMAPLQTLMETVNLEASQSMGVIDPDDLCLLEHQEVGSGSNTPNLRRPNRTEVSWLRRTEYISSEQKSVKVGRTEVVVADEGVYREPLRRPRDVIETVERGFKDGGDWKHPTKPNLQLTQIISVKPSANSFDEVIFDADPNMETAVLMAEQDLMILYDRNGDHVRDYDLVRTEKPGHLFVIEQHEDEECSLHAIRMQMHLRKHRASRSQRPSIQI